VAENAVVTAREHGGVPAPKSAERPMADGVDASMQRMETPGADATTDPARADAEREQLTPADDAVL